MNRHSIVIRIELIAALLALVALSACGGGGGSNSNAAPPPPPPPIGSGNWDQMIWDQDNWA